MPKAKARSCAQAGRHPNGVITRRANPCQRATTAKSWSLYDDYLSHRIRDQTVDCRDKLIPLIIVRHSFTLNSLMLWFQSFCLPNLLRSPATAVLTALPAALTTTRPNPILFLL